MRKPWISWSLPSAATFAAMVTGCYSYQPAIRPVIAPGTRVQVAFDPPRAVALLPSDPGDSLSAVRLLTGKARELRGDTLVLGQLAAFDARSEGSGSTHYRSKSLRVAADGALVPRTAPGIVVRTWQFSSGRTTGLVVTLGVLGFIAYQLAQPQTIRLGIPTY